MECIFENFISIPNIISMFKSKANPVLQKKQKKMVLKSTETRIHEIRFLSDCNWRKYASNITTYISPNKIMGVLLFLVWNRIFTDVMINILAHLIWYSNLAASISFKTFRHMASVINLWQTVYMCKFEYKIWNNKCKSNCNRTDKYLS